MPGTPQSEALSMDERIRREAGPVKKLRLQLQAGAPWQELGQQVQENGLARALGVQPWLLVAGDLAIEVFPKWRYIASRPYHTCWDLTGSWIRGPWEAESPVVVFKDVPDHAVQEALITLLERFL